MQSGLGTSGTGKIDSFLKGAFKRSRYAHQVTLAAVSKHLMMIFKKVTTMTTTRGK